jgi:GDP-mannose 6-dehydrogenase
MKVNVYGLGYVGSVSAACLAADGHHVLGVDIDQVKVDSINRGLSSVVEPGLQELISKGTATGRLGASTTATDDAEISLVCVGTPSQENGGLCLDYVARATAEIGDLLRARTSYHVVCVRSTVLPGTVERLVVPMLEEHSGKKAGHQFGVCMNPEFLREGSSIRDYRCPPFTIVGELDRRSGDAIAELYAGLPAPLIRTKLATAEMVKYAGNAFHALKITFANEIGNLCKALGLDGREVMDIFCRDEKLNVSRTYLQPGFAFGGSCLPKDLRALLHKAKELDMEPPVLRSILASNTRQVEQAFRLIKKTGRKKIAVLGLSFKPGTDDLRESPNAELIEMLIGKGYQVSIYDREVSLARIRGANKAYIEQTIPHISGLMKPSLAAALEAAEVVVVAKKSEEFEQIFTGDRSGVTVIDLVSMVPDTSDQKANIYEGICW